MDKKQILIKLFQTLFEHFLQNPALARKIPSYIDLSALIRRDAQKVAEEILPLVENRNSEALKERCYQLGLLHKRLGINEILFFREVEFFRNALEFYKKYLNLDENSINFWIKFCKEGVALAYMDSAIKDISLILDISTDFGEYFKLLFDAISTLLKEREDSKNYLKVVLPPSPIQRFLNSVEINLKTYKLPNYEFVFSYI